MNLTQDPPDLRCERQGLRAQATSSLNSVKVYVRDINV